MNILALPRAGAAAAFGVATAIRGTRILHPCGTVYECSLTVESTGAWGARVLDRPAEHVGVVRLSRSVGLPEPLPDIEGLALRLPGLGADGRPLDVLVVSAVRFAFVPSGISRTWSSILPYRTGSGRLVLIGTRPDEHGFEMVATGLTGPWRRWGHLRLRAALGEPDMRTEPTLGADDLTPVSLFRRFRAEAYVASQSAR